MTQIIRQYCILMPESKVRPELSNKDIEVWAAVWYNRGLQVEIKAITQYNNPLIFKELPSSLQTKLKEELRQAEMLRRSYGYITCPHNKYMVRDPCIDCFAKSKATP